jgi:small subunit ribosomal protein S18
MNIKKRRVKGGLNLRVPAAQMIDYKDLELLEKCLSPQGQIQHRKRTGFSAQRQKQLKQAIKRARHMALLPFVN